VAAGDAGLSSFERLLWDYSRAVVSGIHDYLAAAGTERHERHRTADAALKGIALAIEQLRASAPDANDTWAAYDLEWIGDIWLRRLRRRFDELEHSLTDL
jgi:hypothetical protein